MTDTYSKKADFKLFSSTINSAPEVANENVQKELIELQSNEFCNPKLGAISTSVIEFYKKYFSENKRFPKLIDPPKSLFACLEVRIYLSSYFRKWNILNLKSDRS